MGESRRCRGRTGPGRCRARLLCGLCRCFGPLSGFAHGPGHDPACFRGILKAVLEVNLPHRVAFGSSSRLKQSPPSQSPPRSLHQPPPGSAGARLAAGGSGRWKRRLIFLYSLEERLWDLHIVPLDAEPAPAFTLESLAGERVSLSDLRGRAVLLYFWATW
jgi:hypothetical protein